MPQSASLVLLRATPTVEINIAANELSKNMDMMQPINISPSLLPPLPPTAATATRLTTNDTNEMIDSNAASLCLSTTKSTDLPITSLP